MKNKTVQTIYSDDLVSGLFLGEVVDINDPQREGKIRIKIFGIFDDVPSENIPWAQCMLFSSAGSGTGSGTWSLPKLGSLVRVRFQNGNPYLPMWESIDRVSRELKEKLSEESDYLNAHVLVFDTEENLYIYRLPSEGLFFRLGSDDDSSQQIKFLDNGDLSLIINNGEEQKIELLEESKTIKISNSSQIVTIDGNSGEIKIESDKTFKIVASSECTIDSPKINLGNGAVESLVLGTAFKTYFDTHTHTGNLGAPTTPPLVPMPPNTLSTQNKSL